MKYKDLAIVFEPHFMTRKVRASVDNQQGKEWNFVLITCSPSNNGLYKYPASLCKDYSIWSNRGRECYEIPMRDLEMVKELGDIKRPDLIEEIKKSQKEWLKISKRKSVPEWFL